MTSARSSYPPPVSRQLRGYALDPSLAQLLETAPISEILFNVPWEPLDPGPIGEYLEVIDYDPAAKCFYEPVRLDDPSLLAQDGLPLSEGTPQFHQQMVYAVASLTIANFERALGRRALWSPGPPAAGQHAKNDAHYVQRLRIYPHALREPNAYYSPAKKALLFGYFAASDDDPSNHVPGGVVFTCLSHDIIAHETTHALLDGIHRRLNQPTNPDVLAFHEAFADIVALFQHFTFPDILRHQMAHTRGDIRAQENLLGQLASQFGRATGTGRALRDAIGEYNDAEGRWVPHERDPAAYERTLEPHARGAILVAAIFDAFISIFSARVTDLFRLATGGTGVLPAGSVHPDLVNRLSIEASKSAAHVLTMCVRGLDYCPPVDLTFGEYLRAVITADFDMVPNDHRHYRVALVEAFRRRGIYPRDVRTLSAENLRWRTPKEDDIRPSAALLEIIGRLREFANRQLYAHGRENIFHNERAARQALHTWLGEHFRTHADGQSDAAFLGIDIGAPESVGQSFEVHAAHFVTRAAPNGDLHFQIVLHLTQETSMRADVDAADRADEAEPDDGVDHGMQSPPRPTLRVEGGSTVIANLKTLEISYCIRKPIGSVTRRARQRAFMNQLNATTLHTTYFGGTQSTREPFALLHRGGV